MAGTVGGAGEVQGGGSCTISKTKSAPTPWSPAFMLGPMPSTIPINWGPHGPRGVPLGALSSPPSMYAGGFAMEAEA